MTQFLTLEIFLTGIVVFLARIADVSLGTLRTISVVKGQLWISFWLGIVEMSIWLVVISTVVLKIKESPVIAAFFVFGFALGNVAGIMLEKWLAFGDIALRLISRKHHLLIAQAIRQAGFGVTTFLGEGMSGMVAELYIICPRRKLKSLINIVNKIEPGIFYVTEQVGEIRELHQPIMQQASGWRNILKKSRRLMSFPYESKLTRIFHQGG